MIVKSSDLEEVRKRRLLIDNCDAYLFGQIRPYLGKRILEVGCGRGNLIPHLLDREQVVAVDVDPICIVAVRERFAHHRNVAAEACDIEAPRAIELRRYECDTVLSLNMLEHVEKDEAALRNVASILVPGGRAIIIVPAFQALYGTMDASIGHYRRYTQSTLAEKLFASGLQIERQYYFNMFGTLGWFFNGRILRQRVPPSSQLRLYNLLFPVVSRVEALIPPVIGLSLVSISRRR